MGQHLGRHLHAEHLQQFDRERPVVVGAVAVRRVVEDPQIALEPLLSFEAGSSPVDTELFRAIEAAAAGADNRQRLALVRLV